MTKRFQTPIPEWSEEEGALSSIQHSGDAQTQTPEGELFLGILLLKIQDAFKPTYYDNPSERDLIQRRARNWLFHNKDEFEAVCDSAGVDPSWLRETLKKRLNAR